jgi:hypothetical protein
MPCGELQSCKSRKKDLGFRVLPGMDTPDRASTSYREAPIMLTDLAVADRDWYLEELYIAWRAASAEADVAFTAWKRLPDRDHYAVYLAATDQADAAAMQLAAEHARVPPR